MCGRYVNPFLPQDLADLLNLPDDTRGEVRPDYNVAPTATVPAVVVRHGERALVGLRWGLVPSWAKDLRIGARLINARVETLAEKPAFRAAFERRRCLLPAGGYYEWAAPAAPGAPKQPYYLRPTDGPLLMMAGLYEFWRDAEGRFWRTSTVITTAAPDRLGRVHERTPMTVDRDSWSIWLDPEVGPEQLDVRGLLRPMLDGALEAVPVSIRVNDVRNNGSELVDPVAEVAEVGEAAKFPSL